MSLGKWAANDARLLGGIPSNIEEVPVYLDETVSALGLKWRPSSNTFHFSLRLATNDGVVTKRLVLSETARLFDPLGWLAPVIVIPKLIMQDLWLLKLEWDDPLPADLLVRWREFRSSLENLDKISIPRYNGVRTDQTWSLHGFCDASKRAYAAVVYSVSSDGKSTLLMAKTKVAPLRVQSIPRLELCGAVLLVRLTQHLSEHVLIQPVSINFWTDSKVVLDWLRAHPAKWQTFVANRVSEIQATFPTATWRHVTSIDNPADSASRGAYPAQLDSPHLWWSGPCWLNTFTSSNTPNFSGETPPDQEILAHSAQEARPSAYETFTAEMNPGDLYQYLSRFSSINKLYRFLARCIRWRSIAQRKETPKQHDGFSVAVWAAARRAFIYIVQHRHFPSELSICQEHRMVRRNSPLIRFSPFLGKDGLLRVGGRLANAALPYQEKHPVILPRCDLVRRLIEYAHLLTCHGGPQVIQS